jgi:hypothetical protein
MSATDFVNDIKAALKSNPRPYFPRNKSRRREKNLKLGREIGYGLGPFDDWLDVAKRTYSQLIVINSFDSIGVVIDNDEWIDAIREGVREYRGE